jgi:hypothetical protein
MEELERERRQSRPRTVRDPEKVRALEWLRLARTELTRQLELTTHEQRKKQIHQALEELDRRMKEAEES